jgi:hypothetical protein
MAWVAPVTEADDYDFEFFQSIIDACIGCFPVLPVVNETMPLSSALSQFYISAEEDGREIPSLPMYEKAFQQTSSFPGPDAMEAIIRKLDEVMPVQVNSTYAFISQMTSGAGSPLEPDERRGLSFQADVFGITTDIFYADPTQQPLVANVRNEYNGIVLKNLGEDHRMYWGAYGNVSFPKDVPLYFDSDEKYNRLQGIKACVDPGNLFQHRMSIPLDDSSLGATSPTATPMRESAANVPKNVYWTTLASISVSIAFWFM